MQSTAQTPQQYIDELPPDRKEIIMKMRDAILANLPEGFEEVIGYGMLGYVVPHSIYPKGYHCNPKLPLPFMNLGSQKNFIALYATNVYGDENLKDWFVAEYPKHSKAKLDMGKGCIRFKKMDDIPYQLIGELSGKLTLQQWITICEKTAKK
ncbi:MAG: DUF1801 domain-containing protein [Mucilaginibacter sp.]